MTEASQSIRDLSQIEVENTFSLSPFLYLFSHYLSSISSLFLQPSSISPFYFFSTPLYDPSLFYLSFFSIFLSPNLLFRFTSSIFHLFLFPFTFLSFFYLSCFYQMHGSPHIFHPETNRLLKCFYKVL